MKYLSYCLIILGAVLAMYGQVYKNENQLLLIIGIVVLMLGVYNISRTIPSKEKPEQLEVKEEEDAL